MVAKGKPKGGRCFFAEENNVNKINLHTKAGEKSLRRKYLGLHTKWSNYFHFSSSRNPSQLKPDDFGYQSQRLQNSEFQQIG